MFDRCRLCSILQGIKKQNMLPHLERDFIILSSLYIEVVKFRNVETKKIEWRISRFLNYDSQGPIEGPYTISNPDELIRKYNLNSDDKYIIQNKQIFRIQ